MKSQDDFNKQFFTSEVSDQLEIEKDVKIETGDHVFLPRTTLKCRELILRNCTINQLPHHLQCSVMEITGCDIQTIPPGWKVQFQMKFAHNKQLNQLPPDITVGKLIIEDCVNLITLPENLSTHFLEISNCPITEIPDSICVDFGHLIIRECQNLRKIPPSIRNLAVLDIRDCTTIESLPEGLKIFSEVELANTNLKTIPKSITGRILWKGVPISQEVILHPETITVKKILEEKNVELRRILLERIGYSRFLKEAKPTIVDSDKDRGGLRQLIKIELDNDEPLVVLKVSDPSTGREYIIRVHPKIEGCHQAAAWIAGFDDPKDYEPIEET